jgi:hypothetical protein
MLNQHWDCHTMGTGEYGSHRVWLWAMGGYHAEFSSVLHLIGGETRIPTRRNDSMTLSSRKEWKAGNVTSGFTRDGCTATVMYCHIYYTSTLLLKQEGEKYYGCYYCSHCQDTGNAKIAVYHASSKATCSFPRGM